jgi:uncharacterized membrane protein
MTLPILCLSTAAIFLVLDAVMLNLVMVPLFQSHIGALMLPSPRLLPAAVFYLGYVAGLVWLVSLPAMRAGRPAEALVRGAVLGAMAYGTFELTSYAILTDWHLSMVLTDTAWGTVLTALSAWGGVRATEALAKGRAVG